MGRSALLGVLLLGGSMAWAQAGVEPPQLEEAPEVEYPERGGDEPHTVLLHLALDASGTVVDVWVVQGAGEPFDGAAAAYARRLRFLPATRDARPVAAKIAYAVLFAPRSGVRADAPVPAGGSAADAVARPSVTGSFSSPLAGHAPLDRELSRHALSDHAPPHERAPVDPPPVEEVRVRGEGTSARLRHSARPVTVLQAAGSRARETDTGTFVAHAQGVLLRRAAGLGSDARLSLNGLSGDQVRFFWDGIPLELEGFPLGVTQIPLDLVERVEVYRGVVPTELGADALGGAVNLVSLGHDQTAPGHHARVAYQVGSFGTYRASANVQHLDEHRWVAGAQAFVDRAKNDYPIEVDVPDAAARPTPTIVHRVHDAYDAYGVRVYGGARERSWAKRLDLAAFVTGYAKELQNNVDMTVPYGAVTYGQRVHGASLEWSFPALWRAAGRGNAVNEVNEKGEQDGERDAPGALGLALKVVYSHTATSLEDDSSNVYDWSGRILGRRATPGEINGIATRERLAQDAVVVRASLDGRLAPAHDVKLTTAPSMAVRTGENLLIPAGREDPLRAPSRLFTWVNGLAYQLECLGGVVANELFAKDYLEHATGTVTIPGIVARPVTGDAHTDGAGDALRVRPLPGLSLKASYEYATRLPRTEELFGDGVLTAPSLDLTPEESHNANLGVLVDPGRGADGHRLSFEANAFYRDARQLIVPLPNGRGLTFQNVGRVRGAGIEAHGEVTSPGGWLTAQASVTYQDLRNQAASGPFAIYAGDRIPNTPYLFANGGATFVWRAPFQPSDELSVGWLTHYVHAFYRSWESVGLASLKPTVDAQLVHSAYVTYAVRRVPVLSATLELDNLTDARVYDYYGVQRPGRAVYFKGALDL